MGVDVRVQLLDRNACERFVVPAYRAAVDHGDPALAIRALQAVLESAEREAQASAAAVDVDVAEVSYTIRDLGRGSGVDAVRRIAESRAGSLLVEGHCLVRPRSEAEVDMTRTRLPLYLYDHSEWIEGIFTYRIGIKGGWFQPSPGESSEQLSTAEVQRFAAELRAVPRPDGDGSLRSEFDRLVAMVSRVERDPGLMLLVTIY